MSTQTIQCPGSSINVSAVTNGMWEQIVTVRVGAETFTFRGHGENNTSIGSKTVPGPATLIIDVRTTQQDSKTTLELGTHKATIKSDDGGGTPKGSDDDYNDCIVYVTWK